MSKRSQTTGLPKTKRKASGEEEKPHKTRAEREAEIQRWVILGTGITVGVVILIIAAALIIDLLIEPNQVVAEVNGETITVAQFEDRVRLERALLNQEINSYISFLRSLGQDPDQFAGQEPLRTWLSQVQVPEQLGNRVVNDMVDELIIRQQAAERGITVSEEDIQTQINQFFDFDPETAGAAPTPTLTPTITPTPFVSPTPSPEPSPTPTPAVEETAEATPEATVEVEATVTPFPTIPPTETRTPEEEIENFQNLSETFFADIRASANVSEEVLRSYFEAQALREALRDNITEDITTDALHVDARHILIDTEENALDILDALENGELFSDLARAASTDTGSGQRGGELGWSPVQQFVEPFAEAVTTADLGVTVGPVESEFGFHIIQVHDRETRELTEDQLNQFKESDFASWLETFREEQQDTWEIFPIWTDFIPSNPPFVLTG